MLWRITRIHLTPFSIVIFYACIGGIWLLLNFTQTFTYLFHEPVPLAAVELDHSLFILISAWLLYFLIRKSEADIIRRKDSLSRVNRSLKAYSECHQALIRSSDEMQLMQDVCRTIVEVGSYRVAWVGQAEDDEERSIRPVAQWGDEKGYLKNLNASWSNTSRGMGPTGTAIRTGKPAMCLDIHTDPAFAPWREEALRRGYAASIALPLAREGKILGAVMIYARDPNPFSQDEIALLSEIASDLAYGIAAMRVQAAQRAAEEALRESENRFRMVIENAKSPVAVLDDRHRFAALSAEGAAVLRREREELLGTDARHLLTDAGLRTYQQALRKLERGSAREIIMLQVYRGGILQGYSEFLI